ncbi:MAG: lipoate--protein ligase family protein [Planctomycetaceae bacterium]|nr:lipoate--protein ligase family protein [Planctomycetaceae bacterium]
MTHDEGNPSSDLGARDSTFRLLLDPPASGSWNMAVDEALLEAATEGHSTLRFYRWSEPTLSLGYFQTYKDRFAHEASRDCAVVRRSSGGGAILHDIELTYSLAVPEQHPLAATRLKTYRAVHFALIAALKRWQIEAGMLTCATAPRPDGGREPFLCFQRRSPGDVLVGCHKVAGSAQRRCRGAVLQHGSLLLARSPAAPELDGLKELGGKPFSAEEFTQAWLQELSGVLGVAWRQEQLPAAQRRRAAAIEAEKYAAALWTENRGRSSGLH